MKVIVVGCGRVGSSVALELSRAGWDGFFVGHGMDMALLRDAGIEEADAVVVSTNGDNTNLVIGQVAQKHFDVRCVVVRVLDPARADFYASRGLSTVCPTSNAIAVLTEAVRSHESSPTAAA